MLLLKWKHTKVDFVELKWKLTLNLALLLVMKLARKFMLKGNQQQWLVLLLFLCGCGMVLFLYFLAWESCSQWQKDSEFVQVIFFAALTSGMSFISWEFELLVYGLASIYVSALYNACTSSASFLCSNCCKFLITLKTPSFLKFWIHF